MKKWNSADEEEAVKERKAFLDGLEPQLIADDFPMFASRQELVRCLVRYELFKQILNTDGTPMAPLLNAVSTEARH